MSLSLLRGPRVLPRELLPSKAESLIDQGVYNYYLDSSRIERTLSESEQTHLHGAVLSEGLRAREIARIFRAFEKHQIKGILLKGSALAYSVYPKAYWREREDTDLLLSELDRQLVLQVFRELGYEIPLTSISIQEAAQVAACREDEFGVFHSIDLHFSASNRPTFENIFTFKEVLGFCQTIIIGGQPCLSLAKPYALLHACVHPVMHHHNEERLIWKWDILLLLQKMTEADYQDLFQLIKAKNMAGPVLSALRPMLNWQEVKLNNLFKEIEALLVEGHTEQGKLTQKWRRQSQIEWQKKFVQGQSGIMFYLLGDVLSAKGLGHKLKRFKLIFFPQAQYMYNLFGIKNQTLGRLVLPGLYFWRALRGMIRLLVKGK